MTKDEYKAIHDEIMEAWDMLQGAYQHMLSADILVHDCRFPNLDEGEQHRIAMAKGFENAELAFHTATIELSKADVACYKEAV